MRSLRFTCPGYGWAGPTDKGEFFVRKPTRALATTVATALVFMLMPVAAPVAAFEATSAVFINEIHYDNTGTDAGEAIEIVGPAGTDLTGWSIILYNGSGGAVYDTDPLAGVLSDQGGGYGTVVLNYPANGIQNGSPDGIALVNGTTLVQFLSYEGTFVGVGGPADGLTSTDIGVAEAGTEAIGMSLQVIGSGVFNIDEGFVWSGPSTASFGAINPGQSFGGGPINQPIALGCSSITTAQGTVGTSAVTATDPDGVVASLAISTITPSDPGTISLEGFTPATAVGGTAQATLTVAAATPAGTYGVEISASNGDDPPQTAVCTVTVTVSSVLTVGQVQGAVPDGVDGLTHRSPFAPATGNGAGATVIVTGVITQKTLARTSSGGIQNGFFLQSTLAFSDGDPTSSDGVFVFMGAFPDLIGGYLPVVGDEVVLSARVTEFFNLTELTSASLVTLVRSGVDLTTEIVTAEANPPSDLAEANRYWERIEGMQISIPAGSVVLNGRNVFPSTLDGEVWVARGDSTIGARTAPFTDRSFRDPHPLDDLPPLFDNGNGYRIVLGSLGIKAAMNDSTALIAPSRTFDRLTQSTTGGVYFSFNKYQIQVADQLVLAAGLDPSTNSPPPAPDRSIEYSIVTYNMENLYDFVDDPNDGCDFAGNAGCPGVNPPFDYVPASQAAYDAKLADLAAQITEDLNAPDVVMVQEIEDQDLDLNGSPDSLDDLAAAVLARGGPGYAGAYDPDGADDRGITAAFFFRTDRVVLIEDVADDPVLGSSPTVVYRGEALPSNTDVSNPKALNADLPDDVDLSTGVDGNLVFTRAPEVALFRVWRSGIGTSVWEDIYAISNHFSSTPNARVGQRTEQALYNAAIVTALQESDPDVRVVVGGDLNVYPRPDDPFTTPSDQLGPLYDIGLTNLYDLLVSQVPASAYSYVFEGQAQTLDHQFVTASVLPELITMRAAHINSDWPADHPGDGARGVSDHDPQAALHSLEPTTDRIADLVQLWADQGGIKSNTVEQLLLIQLDGIQSALDQGRPALAKILMRLWILQVRAFTPGQITVAARNSLVAEASLWIQSN
jgi:predicted extracellular nuclease